MRKPKQRKSICMEAFPSQFKSLRPENSAAGGVKARSGSEAVRMEIYKAISDVWRSLHRWCECCTLRNSGSISQAAVDIHHVHGRDGLLLFDVRYWLAVCRPCHNWIHAHPKQARELGLLK